MSTSGQGGYHEYIGGCSGMFSTMQLRKAAALNESSA